MTENNYRLLWNKYINDVYEIKNLYSSKNNSIEDNKIIKNALCYLNYLMIDYTYESYGIPFDIDLSKLKKLDFINLFIYASNDINDYKNIIEDTKSLIQSQNGYIDENFILKTLDNIIPFCDIANELGEYRYNDDLMDLNIGEYNTLIGQLSQNDKINIRYIETARDNNFNVVFYDLNNGRNSNGCGDFYCCILKNNQCSNVRFFCKDLKDSFLLKVENLKNNYKMGENY